MNVRPNFRTKKALKEAVAAGEHVLVCNPGSFDYDKIRIRSGTVAIEGPNHPEPCKWRAWVTVEDGKIITIK